MEKVRGDWVKRTCCRMAGEEKFGYFRLCEGTEGEDGSLSSGCGWLEVLCVWNMIKNHCFRTLILKLVNPLELLEDRIAIHI